MYITNVKKTKEEKTRSGVSVWWLLSEEIGVPNFEMRYFEFKKGMHTSYGKHPWEHEVFVVKGEGVIKGKNFEQKIKAGDAIYIAPNEEHQFLNNNDEPFGLICIIPKGAEKRKRSSLKSVSKLHPE